MSGGRYNRSAIILAPLVCVFLFIGCTRPGQLKKDQIEHIMALREEAMEKKEIGLYMGCIDHAYQDGDTTYVALRDRMQKNFDVFDTLEFSSFKRSVYIQGSQATVVQDYELAYTMGGKRDYLRGKEKILLEEKCGGWKIIKGL